MCPLGGGGCHQARLELRGFSMHGGTSGDPRGGDQAPLWTVGALPGPQRWQEACNKISC